MNEDIYETMHQLEQYNGELLHRHQADKEKIQRLEKQLEIAVAVLECYANPDNWEHNRFTNFLGSWKFAQDNLFKTKELE